MPAEILTEATVTLTDLKTAPMKALATGKGRPVAILNHAKPVFYAVPAELFAQIHEILEDRRLMQIAAQRVGSPGTGRMTMAELEARDAEVEAGKAATKSTAIKTGMTRTRSAGPKAMPRNKGASKAKKAVAHGP